MNDENKKKFMEQAYNAIQICLSDEDIRKVFKETTTVILWEKLENFYMTKSLTNRLYMKY